MLILNQHPCQSLARVTKTEIELFILDISRVLTQQQLEKGNAAFQAGIENLSHTLYYERPIEKFFAEDSELGRN